MAHSELAGRSSSRPRSVCCPLHRADVRLQEHVAGQERILLRLRLLERRQRHPYHHRQRGHHCCDLYPAMLRGKPLTTPPFPSCRLIESATEPSVVVAKFLRRGRQRDLGIRLLHLVLCHSPAHPGFHLQHPLLQLQLPGLCRLWAFDRHRWVSHRVYFCQASLQVC